MEDSLKQFLPPENVKQGELSDKLQQLADKQVSDEKEEFKFWDDPDDEDKIPVDFSEKLNL